MRLRDGRQWRRRASTIITAGALSLGALAAAPVPRPDPWTWPTGEPADVVTSFAPPDVPWGSGHRGVDLDLREGAQVLSAGEGVVVYAGDLAGRGVVSVDHAGGLRTTYEPVTATVTRGQRVSRGQPLGELEEGHCASACLHFGVREGPDDYIDPLSLFGPVRIRLLPLY